MASNAANTTTKPGVLESIDSAAGWIGAYVGGTAGNAHANALYEARATVERLAAAAKRLLEAYDDSASEFEAAAAAQQVRDELAAFRGEA